jgi:hypothetical protein
MLSGILGFPLQPVNGHPFITSWSLSLEPIFFLPSDEMAGRHLLHNTPMWFYTKFINRKLVLEEWFEKPKNRLFGKIRLFGHVRVK